MGKTTNIKVQPKRVATLLKRIINNNCEEGFKWFEDVGNEMPTVFDIITAIDILENSPIKELNVLNE